MGRAQLFNFDILIRNIPSLLAALPVTFGVALGGAALGLILAVGLALVSLFRVPFLHRVVAFFVSFMRGTPLLVQLYLVSFGIPRTLHFFKVEYGLFPNLNPMVINPLCFALIGFMLHIGAYSAATIKASVEAVGQGQFEAARSVGMIFPQIILRIILPQAIKIALPILANTFINITKGTSFLYLIGIDDIMTVARVQGMIAGSPFELYCFNALVFWVICFAIELFFGYFEKRMGISGKTLAGRSEA
jgi:L-cystine transport system permease protein